MNVFFIPSWYVSEIDQLAGIFSLDQVKMMIKHYNDISFGISSWGQSDARLFLTSEKIPRDGLMRIHGIIPGINQYENGRLIELYTPTFSTPIYIKNGNIESVIQANIKNFENYTSYVGKVDLIHAHVGFPGGYIAECLSEKYGIPYVITEHMSPFPHMAFMNDNGEIHPFLQKAYRNASKNIAVSNWLKKEMEKKGFSNIQVIHNLVDETIFVPKRSLYSNSVFTFFCLARMDKGKGIDVLINALSKVKSNVILRIGGGENDELLKQYQILARKLKVQNRIVWLGEINRDQAVTEYQNADAFVLPSLMESMGIVYVEAMACGKPVIATCCGGPEDIVENESGYLIPINDIDELAIEMDRMVDNYNSFDSKKIRKMFEDKFSSKVICAKIRDTYEQVINQNWL